MTDRFSKSDNSTSDCHDLKSYCGGTFKGILYNLEHITDMGFNAIWISPVPENIEHGYHGYWAKNLYNINSHFGSADDLRALIEECHKRDVWVMVDVVVNHMGATSKGFDQFYPFNHAKYYHDFCLIENYSRQREVEFCRIGDMNFNLPDLNTERKDVIHQLHKWIRWLIMEFKFDGIRVDTVKHIRKDFWRHFTNAAGVFSLGEVWHGDPKFVAQYQGSMDSMLNYPMYYTIIEVFHHKKSMWELEKRWKELKIHFRDISSFGNFIDNHDVSRFFHKMPDISLIKNALAFILFFNGLPIVYQGTEYLFRGSKDPYNREALWPMLHSSSSDAPLNGFFKQINSLRSFLGNSFFHAKYHPYWSAPDAHVFMRDKALVVLTNRGSRHDVSVSFNLPISEEWINILDQSGNDKLRPYFENGRISYYRVLLPSGNPKIYVPRYLVEKSGQWNKFFRKRLSFWDHAIFKGKMFN